MSILKYIDKSYSSFIFTGASFLDLSDLEHFPFRTIRKYHFLDDPICKYTRTIGLPKNHKFDEEIKKQLELAIEDNIKIIENCAEEIYILPISFCLMLIRSLFLKLLNRLFLVCLMMNL
jgi:hypothetical protein